MTLILVNDRLDGHIINLEVIQWDAPDSSMFLTDDSCSVGKFIVDYEPWPILSR